MSFDVDIQFSGLDAVAAAVERVVTSAGAIQRRAVQPFGRRTAEALVKATPKGRGEAQNRVRLSESYETTENYDATGAEYHIVNQAPYLRWVLEGRGPIEAKQGRMLRFVIDGQVFFRKRVGPAAANPFDRPVTATAQSEARGVAEQMATDIARAFGGN